MKIVIDEVVPRPVPKCKVLLVDDDAFMHEMMALFLGKTILWTMLEQADGSVMDASGKADILMNKPFYRCDILENLERAKLMLGRRASANDITFDVAA